MSLANLLATQQRHLDTLVDLLLREQELLIQGIPDGEQLSELARLKQAELKAIETIETGRRRAQQKLGYEAGLRGAEEAARDARCTQQWQTLQDGAARVAHLNELNGTLIEQRMQHNQQVLTLLRELARDTLYGQDGQQNRTGGHINSSA